MMKYSLFALVCCPLAMFATPTNNLAAPSVFVE